MGMTLWIHTLEGRHYSKDSDDHSLMHRQADDLDEICTKSRVTKLSEFFDFTDLDFNYSHEFIDELDEGESDDIEDDAEQLDPETGLGYGIDDMTWFDASEGKNTLSVLSMQYDQAGFPALGVRKPAN